MISLDGSTLEGGGQLVRVALALSAITSTPIRIDNIRANRAPAYNRRGAGKNGIGKGKVEGGLKESHLAALEWLASQTDARVQGAEVGSREVVFRPRGGERKRGLLLGDDGGGGGVGESEGKGKRFEIELMKPGSVWLVFQAVLPYVVFAMGVKRVELVLKGGTNVDKSMSAEYVVQVLLPVLKRIVLGGQLDVNVGIVKRGWAGNAPAIGEVEVVIEKMREGGGAVMLEGFEMKDRGEVEKVVVSVIARPEETRRMVIERMEQVVKMRLGVPVEIAVDEDSVDERRFYILIVAHTTYGWRLGRDFLGGGAKIKDAAQLHRLIDGSVKKVVDGLETEIKRGGCVDEHMQDQLVIFQALAKGSSIVDAGKGRGDGTLHTRTVRWVCEEILEETVKFGEDGSCNCASQDGVEYAESRARLKINDSPDRQ